MPRLLYRTPPNRASTARCGTASPTGRIGSALADGERCLRRRCVRLVGGDALADYLTRNNLGPHRGVEALADYLTRQQAEGVVRDDVDPSATAFLLVAACFLRVSQRLMINEAYGPGLPGLSDLIETIDTLLTPRPRTVTER